MQRQRTPSARRQIRFFDEFVETLEMERWLSDRAAFAAHAREVAPDMSADEIEEFRTRSLNDLQAGTLVMKAPPAREIALMFMHLDKTVPQLLHECDWIVLRATEEAPDLVLPDVGIAQIDPTPKHPRSGVSWMSSPNSETTFPLDPRIALLVTPGSGLWSWLDVEASDVEDINLRSYAASEMCYFGTSQEGVCSVRRVAKKDAARVGRYARRPSRLWVHESHEHVVSGDLEFVGHSPDDVVRGRFHVSAGASRQE